MSEPSSEQNHSITPANPVVIPGNNAPVVPKRRGLVLVLSVSAMLLLIIGIGALKALQFSKAIAQGKAFKMPPDAVTSLTLKEEEEYPSLDAVGSISSPKGVMLSADLPGIVEAISFESGSTATNGQQLVHLDTRQEEAQLRTSKAKQELARQNLERAQDLNDKRVIAKSAYDEAKSSYDAAVASTEEIQATIDRKTIQAPFSGVLGIRQVNIGQYLKSGDPIVQIESLDPIYVNFALPQQYLGKLFVGQQIRLQADGLPEKIFLGTVTAIDAIVDTSTRNIQVQATLSNPDHLLRSGMFAAVQVLLPEKKNIIMIPATAIQYAPYGDSVFVIEQMKAPSGADYLGVRQQTVFLGKTRGDQIEVVKGLKAGEEIVTSGTFKLRQGSPVKVNNSVQPGNNPEPKPQES